jgi:hypothetical protein
MIERVPDLLRLVLQALQDTIQAQRVRGRACTTLPGAWVESVCRTFGVFIQVSERADAVNLLKREGRDDFAWSQHPNRRAVDNAQIGQRRFVFIQHSPPMDEPRVFQFIFQFTKFIFQFTNGTCSSHLDGALFPST